MRSTGFMEQNIQRAAKGSFFEGFTHYLLGLAIGIGSGIAAAIIFYTISLLLDTPSGGAPQPEDYLKMLAFFGAVFFIFFAVSALVSLIFNIVKAIFFFKSGKSTSGHTIIALTIASVLVVLFLLTPILLIF